MTTEQIADAHRTVAAIPVANPKKTREALCAAQSALHERARAGADGDRVPAWVAQIGALIEEIDVHRPLGPDGKHADRHTLTCGCTRTPTGETA